MKHKKRWLILGVCLLLFLGLVFRYVPFNLFTPDKALFPPPASAFHLKFDSPLPSELKVGDQLTVSARLVSNSWMSYRIRGVGADIYIDLKKPGEEIAIMYSNYLSILWAGVDKTATRTIDVSNAGDYTLTVFAYFFIGDQEYKYRLDSAVFHIVE